MASSNTSNVFDTYDFTPTPEDGFVNLRKPESRLDLAKERLSWQWTLFTQKSAVPSGDRTLETNLIINCEAGIAHLINIVSPSRKWPERFLIQKVEEMMSQLDVRYKTSKLINDLLKSGKLRYLNQREFDQLAPDSRICGISRLPFAVTVSKDWLDPIPVPEICLPEIVRSLPLGTDDRMKFESMIDEIWKRIRETKFCIVESPQDPFWTLSICCQQIGKAIEKYQAMSVAEKQVAEIQKLPHYNGEEQLEIASMMYRHKKEKASKIARLIAKCKKGAASEVEEDDSDSTIAPEQVVETHCGHRFGIVSLGNWLAENKTCPMCRQEVFQEYNNSLGTIYVWGYWEYFAYNLLQRMTKEQVREYVARRGFTHPWPE